MIIKNVTLYIKPQFRLKFIKATLLNQENSRKEKGVQYFEFLESQEDPNKFILLEAYALQEDMDSHLTTNHFKKWIETVEDWFEKPRKKEIFTVINENF
jgi:autoinducer 2-degrading protein